MKKVALLILIILITILSFGFSCTASQGEIIRLHIRANSENQECQDIKNFVRDVVLVYISDEMSVSNSTGLSRRSIEQRLACLENLANGALLLSGKNYSATVSLSLEFFPDREYLEFFLPEGYYYALVISLGSGEGSNWWCVVYPTICYGQFGETNISDIEYRSFIWDFIKGR